MLTLQNEIEKTPQLSFLISPPSPISADASIKPWKPKVKKSNHHAFKYQYNAFGQNETIRRHHKVETSNATDNVSLRKSQYYLPFFFFFFFNILLF